MRILLVNDNGELNNLFSDCLEFSVHQVYKCTSCSLERVLRFETFDLVFVSIENFDDSELKLFETVRGFCSNKDVFVVSVCTEFSEPFIMDAFNSGVDEYLVRPVIADDVALLFCFIERVKGVKVESFPGQSRLAA